MTLKTYFFVPQFEDFCIVILITSSFRDRYTWRLVCMKKKLYFPFGSHFSPCLNLCKGNALINGG